VRKRDRKRSTLTRRRVAVRPTSAATPSGWTSTAAETPRATTPQGLLKQANTDLRQRPLNFCAALAHCFHGDIPLLSKIVGATIVAPVDTTGKEKTMNLPKHKTIKLSGICEALLMLGTLASDIRGSIGGTTYARNRSGAYARNRTKPVNPGTPLQTSNRARFANQSNAWGALTPDNRESWVGTANGLTVNNRLGQAYTPSGRQLFLQVNNNLAVIAGTPLVAPAADMTPPDIAETIHAEGNVTTGSIHALTGVDFSVVAGTYTVVEATPVQANLRTNFNKQFRQIGVFDSSSATPDLVAAYEAKFGSTAAVGQVIAFRFKTVSADNGMASASVTYVTTLA
jgi:hypothetical protein